MAVSTTIYGSLPNLKERRQSQGTRMSGGELQMLAIARICEPARDCCSLDEPTEGLAPVIVQQIAQLIAAPNGSAVSPSARGAELSLPQTAAPTGTTSSSRPGDRISRTLSSTEHQRVNQNSIGLRARGSQHPTTFDTD